MVVNKEKEHAMSSAAKIATLAPKGPESSALLKGVIELSDDESKGLIASFAATAGAGPSAELNREEIPGDRELAWKLFVELNREAIGIPGDGGLVDLVSDDEGVAAADAGEEKEVVPGDEEKEGTLADNGLPEQTAAVPSPPPSA